MAHSREKQEVAYGLRADDLGRRGLTIVAMVCQISKAVSA